MIKCIRVHVGASMAHLPNYQLLCEIGINEPTSASSQVNGAGISLSLSQLHLQCPSPHAHTYLSMFLQPANCVDRFHPTCVFRNGAPLALSCELRSKRVPHAIVH